MKITRAIGYEVVVPVHPGRANSAEYGPAVFDEPSKWIVEVHADSGLTGIGESLRGTGEASLRAALSKLAGRDLTTLCIQEPPTFDLSDNDMFAHDHPQRPNRLIEWSFNDAQHLAVHAALFDLLGKRAELPAHALMGGAYRARVPVDTWMGRMTPEDSARVCREAQQQGFRGAKMKCALEDDNVERAQAIKEACGSDFKLTFDPNARFYRYGEAMPMLRRLAEVGNIGCVEDPFHKGELEQYRMLRAQGLFPVALHLSYSPTLIDAIRHHACDYVNLGGTPWDIRKAADVCWLAGLPTWHGSGIDLGVLEALYLHVVAAGKSMARPSDILGRTIRQHNLITNPMKAEGGYMPVPTGHGLGVELDRDALERYTVRKTTLFGG
jgi:muconate cycloisomerase